MNKRLDHEGRRVPPLFSVVIPAYNAEKFLTECLASVARQTFRGFELVVVDDGSTDGTFDMLERFARQQEPASVLLIHQENRGRLSARRAGLKQASGKYVVFLDSDDCLRPDALEVLAECIKKTHADIVVFGMSNKSDFSRPQFSRGLPFGFFGGGEYRIAPQCVARGASNTLWGKAISLAAFDAGTDYSSYEGLMHGEDLFQLLPVMDRARSCLHIEQALYFYRRHESASTMSYRPEQLDDIAMVCGRLLEYGERWGMVEDAAYGALWNLCCTAKTLLKDQHCDRCRTSELDRFAVVVRSLDLMSRVGSQRVDNRLLLRAILAGKHWEAATIVRAVELAKKVVR